MYIGSSSVNSYSSYSSSFAHTSKTVSISKTSQLQTSNKVLGYEVDKDGYFKPDFNKAAGIPEDFKIHSDTMKSLVNMNETANVFYKMFSKVDIAKTAGNAYKILTQVMDKETLNKDSFTREDIASMPQGYEYNSMNMKVDKVYQKVTDYMANTNKRRAENHHITTTFYNHSVMHYWDSPQGGRLSPSTNIFDSNSGGKEEANTGLYFNTTSEKYTNQDGSVTKGGLLVGIMSKNIHTLEGKTTFWGKLDGADKQVSAKQARLQDKLLGMMYPNINKISDSVLNALSDDLKQYVKDLQKMSRITNGHFSSDVKEQAKETKSPAQILFEEIEKMQKEMLEALREKAKEARIEHQKILDKKLFENQNNQTDTISLQEFTHFFLSIQEQLNELKNKEEEKSDITENELKKAFLGMFDFDENEFKKKNFLDLTA